jgi:hypothetical protein
MAHVRFHGIVLAPTGNFIFLSAVFYFHRTTAITLKNVPLREKYHEYP